MRQPQQHQQLAVAVALPLPVCSHESASVFTAKKKNASVGVFLVVLHPHPTFPAFLFRARRRAPSLHCRPRGAFYSRTHSGHDDETKRQKVQKSNTDREGRFRGARAVPPWVAAAWGAM